MNITRKSLLSLLVIVCLLGGLITYVYGRSLWVPMYQKYAGKRSLSDVVATYGPSARDRLRPYFSAAGIPYPPASAALLGVKDSALLELWASSDQGPTFIRRYPIKALSGVSGPKRAEGDRQVPEGLYKIEGLNPNSSYHLSMKLNYPNPFDREHAKTEGRHHPGSNIFIHGKAVSIGCLAMGDTAIEELFILAADIGPANIGVAIAPSDPRLASLPTDLQPAWVGRLYAQLNTHFSQYQRRSP
jgi:hypothetical protein